MRATVKAALIAGAFLVIATGVGAGVTGHYNHKSAQTEARSNERIQKAREEAAQADKKAQLDRALRLLTVELEQNAGHAWILSVLREVPKGLSARSGTLLPSRVWEANKPILAELGESDLNKWDDLVTYYLRLETLRTALATLSPGAQLNHAQLIWAFLVCRDSVLVYPQKVGEPGIELNCVLPSDSKKPDFFPKLPPASKLFKTGS